MSKKIWVAYKRGEGFLKKNGSVTEDYSNARLYTQKGFISVTHGKDKIESGEIIPFPINIEIPEEDLLMLKLGGNPVIE